MEASVLKKIMGNEGGKLKYYLMLISVVLIWGIVPSIKNALLTDYNYSPAIMTAISAVIAFVAMLIICAKQIKFLNREYFKIALFTGLFYSVACVLQNEGLNYTSPAMYSFLENLSCLVVPLLVWLMTRKRPSVFKFIGAGLCIISLFVLSFRNGITEFNFGIGEIMCGLAGLLYGVNIAVTGIKAKKLDAKLYLLVQFGVHALISTYYSLFLTIYQMYYAPSRITFDTKSLGILVAMVLISTVLGWIIRTICLTHLAPSFVAIVMPFSSIVTAIISVILGQESLSTGLILGAIIGVIAAIISDLDINRIKRKYKYLQYQKMQKQKLATNTGQEEPPKDDSVQN